jgi:hypothetical protein
MTTPAAAVAVATSIPFTASMAVWGLSLKLSSRLNKTQPTDLELTYINAGRPKWFCKQI